MCKCVTEFNSKCATVTINTNQANNYKTTIKELWNQLSKNHSRWGKKSSHTQKTELWVSVRIEGWDRLMCPVIWDPQLWAVVAGKSLVGDITAFWLINIALLNMTKTQWSQKWIPHVSIGRRQLIEKNVLSFFCKFRVFIQYFSQGDELLQQLHIAISSFLLLLIGESKVYVNLSTQATWNSDSF